MNSMCYRVVFNEHLGAWVAVAENVAARGKRSRGRARKLAAIALSVSIAGVTSSFAAPPVVGVTQTPTQRAASISSDTASVSKTTYIDKNGRTTLDVNQKTQSAVVNWQKFDVGSNARVNFVQDGNSSYRTLNRIWDSSPSQIYGQITAPGQVYLVNRNGIVFGKDSQVDVGGLVASALNIKLEDFSKGILSQSGTGNPTFYYAAGKVDPNTLEVVDIDTLTPDVSALNGTTPTVRNEGSIRATSEGGSIMLFAPRVENAGLIETKGGQVVLAAGSKVYLTESKSTTLRGVLVEVDIFNGGDKATSSVSNTGLKEAMKGIIADRGNITLAAMAVNNDGYLRASSGKVENGSIYLQGRYSAVTVLKDNVGSETTNRVVVARQGGEVVLGSNSRIETPVETISAADISARAAALFVSEPGESEAVRNSRIAALEELVRKQYTLLKSDTFKPAEIVIDGRTVLLQGGSSIVAPGASVSLLAAGERKFPSDPDRSSGTANLANTNATYLSGAADDPGARVVVEAGATVDVSGYQNVEVDGKRNQVSATLVSNELKDAPLQRGGVLFGKTVKFNLLDAPSGKLAVADVSGVLDSQQVSLPEMAAKGGSITFQSAGDVVLGRDATLNVSGGSIKVSEATIETTQLALGTQRIDIAKASADASYSGLTTVKRYVPGYVEGKDAGVITVAARGSAVVDANLLGGTVAGAYQTTVATAPKGARFVMGDVLAGQNKAGAEGSAQHVFSYGKDVRLAGGSGLKDTMTFWADPLNATVSDKSYNLLSPDALSAAGFQSVDVYGKNITLAAGAPVNLRAGSSLTLRALGDIDIQDDVRGAGMTLDAQAGLANQISGTLTLGAGKKIDASGMWINDYQSFSKNRSVFTGVRQTQGGSILFKAVLGGAGEARLALLAGSSIDVSGGGELGTGGAVKLGNAGSITLAGGSGVNIGGAVLTGKALSDGTQSGKGGTLTIEAPAIRIGGSTAADAATLSLAPALFARDGFSKVNLTATLGNLNVMAGSVLDLQRSVRQFGGATRNVITGSALSSVGLDGKLAAVVKDGASLSLTATRQTADHSGFDMGVVEVAEGASIDAGTGGSISLTAGRQLTVAGSLRAQAGTVSLNMKKVSADEPTDLADQSIFLGNTALVDVSGKALVTTDRLGHTSGEVLAGGQLSITADKGYIVAQQGATVRLDGASATLYNATNRGDVNVGSDAGSLLLTAPAGVLFGAQTSAQGGSPSAAGGSFSLTQSGSSTNFAASERVVNIGNDVFATGSAVGDVLRLAKPGVALGNDSLTSTQAWVDAKALAASGFDNVSIKSDDRIRFVGDVTLNGRRALTLSAGVLDVAAANATLTGAVVRMGWLGKGDQRRVAEMGVKTPVSGIGSLLVNASQIALSGSIAVAGAGQTTLNSTGDLQLTGVALNREGTTTAASDFDTNTGNLSVSGNLDIKAAQIYPTTLSDFTISVAPGSAAVPSILNISGAGAVPSTPLVAGGRLALQADNINQGGALRAPFGTIDLNARNALTLLDGSLTSASGEGAIIPFGEIVNGRDWTVTPTDGRSRIITAAPTPTVALRGKSVEQKAAAKVDVSGGGDLKAVEWVKGPGGSVDVLAQANTYAIMPGYSSAYAPEGSGLDRMAGTQITLGADSGVPAGTYTLLPGRFALLPGAFKVTLLNAYKDAAPGLQIGQQLGGTVVSGRLSLANTGNSEARTQGVLVESGSVARKRSEYSEALASSFFDSKAEASGIPLSHATADGGHLILAASDSIKLGNKISMDALADGTGKRRRGGMLDVSLLGSTLDSNGKPTGDIVVGNSTAAPTPGVATLPLSDTQIANVGAESVLIGGERSVNADGMAIKVTANNVRYNSTNGFDKNGNKPAEVIIAASNKLTVENGSVIETAAYDATRPASLQASVKGDGALLRVAADDNSVTRTNVAGTQGTLIVEPNVSLKGHAVQADATFDSLISAGSAASAKVFSLGASQINLGGSGGTVGGGTRVSGALLASVATAADSLTLRSYNGIKFDADFIAGGVTPLKGLTFDAPSLEWTGSGSGSVQIDALKLTLTNTTGAAAVASTGAGTLTLNAMGTLADGGDAGILRIGAGDVAMKGFANTSLSATRAVVMSGTGTTHTPGSLQITTPLVTVESGARHSVEVAGALTLKAGSTTPRDVVAGGGAAIKFNADSIVQDTSIINNSGTVTHAATGSSVGDVTLLTGALVDVSSRQTDFNGTVKTTDAGSITLSSLTGSVDLQSGATLDLQGKGDSSAGSLNVLVPKGQVKLDGMLRAGITAEGKAVDASAGKLHVDTGVLASLDDLVKRTIEFEGQRSVRLRKGDMTLSENIVARKIELYTDIGSIYINSTLNASGPSGGSIDLAARRDFVTDAAGNKSVQGGEIVLGANAMLDAYATEAGGRGGKVTLSVSGGDAQIIAGVMIDPKESTKIEFAAGSRIDVRGNSGGADGSITLNAPRVMNLADYNPAVGTAAIVADVGSVFTAPPAPLLDTTPLVVSAALDTRNSLTAIGTSAAYLVDASSDPRYANFDGSSPVTFDFVAQYANTRATGKQFTTLSLNGGTPIKIASNATGTAVAVGQLKAGATYRVMLKGTASNPFWQVDTTVTPINTASLTILPVSGSFGGNVDEIVYFTPQASNFGNSTSNTAKNPAGTLDAVKLSVSGLSGLTTLTKAGGIAIAPGELVAGTSYAAKYSGGQFILLSSAGSHETVRIATPAISGTPADSYDIRFVAAAMKPSDNVEVQLNTGEAGRLYATDGVTPVTSGTLAQGETYSIGRLPDGRFALRPGSFGKISVTAADKSLVAFSLSDVSSLASASSLRLSVNGDTAIQLLDSTGTALRQSLLQAGTTYVASLSGGNYRLVANDALASSVPIVNNGVAVMGAPRTEVNAFKTYVAGIPGNPTISLALRNQVQAEAQQFAHWLPAIGAKLGMFTGPLTVRPGIELRSSGDMTLGSDWSFADKAVDGTHLWRYGSTSAAGSLVMRAGGTLRLNANLNDGFASSISDTPAALADGWRYTLVGGADLSAASALTTQAGSSAQVVVTQKVRTGAGDIRIAAAGDIDLSAPGASVYSAGSKVTVYGNDMASLADTHLTTGGGDVALVAGRNILGRASSDLPTQWLWRSGSQASSVSESAAWLVRFGDFKQQVGALGGGDVTLDAGDTINNVSAALPTQGRFTHDGAGKVIGFQTLNGGNLRVRAGADIVGGQYLVERGTGDIAAAGAIRADSRGAAMRLYGADSQFKLTAGANLALGSISNASILSQATNNVPLIKYQHVAWLSYSADSSLDVRSASGSVALTEPGVLPASLQIVALGGAIDLGGKEMPMYPAARGQLALFAESHIGNANVTMIDLAPSDLPSVIAPMVGANGQGKLIPMISADATKFSDNGVMSQGVRSRASTLAGSLHESDLVPAKIVSRSGDVSGRYIIAKPAEVRAGRDVVDLALTTQNLNGTDVSSVTADRDIVYATIPAVSVHPLMVKDSSNILRPNTNPDLTPGIKVFGPGLLEVTAGRNVELANSAGIVSKGPGVNANLPDSGASIRVVAGKPSSLDAAAFAETYLDSTSAPAFLALSTDKQLAFATDVLRQRFIDAYLQPGGAYLAQWQSYANANGIQAGDVAMNDPAQASSVLFDRFRYRVLWSELSASGQEGQSAAYTRGFKAIDLMGLGAPFKVSGDVRMVFSQIRSQSGGDVDVLVPGGSLDVGAIIEPDTTKVTDPGRLGLVANQGDSHAFVRDSINVNSSRWFAIDGGNLLGWASTGSIDAGKGSRTAVSGSSQRLDVDRVTGKFTLVDGGASTGSGIATIFNRPNTTGGNVELYAPNGFINAGEAGIRAAAKVTTGALAVINAQFISAPSNPPAPPVVAAPGLSLSTGNTSGDKAATEAGAVDTKKARERNSLLTVEVLAAEPERAPAAGATPVCIADPKGGKPICN